MFHLVSGVGRFDVWSNGPTNQRLDNGLRVVSQAPHEEQHAFLLDVVIRQCSCAHQLLTYPSKS